MSSVDRNHILRDTRQVVLIKSLATANRFYALVEPDSGIRNADTVSEIPDNILLGIAYPCLEDGLNDFAVIRTTYETLEFFPDDEEMRNELMEIVTDARDKLIRRLTELRDSLTARKAHFLGTDMEEFKSHALDVVHRGYPRRNLDSMMKLNVFASVAEIEGHAGSEPLFFYRFRSGADVKALSNGGAREFVAALFSDVLDSVLDDTNYESKYNFDRNVFQKFITLMFVNYATTDPIFYGTNRADYGVSDEKDMSATPLYMAVARALVDIELKLLEEARTGTEAPSDYARGERPPWLVEQTVVQLPGTLVNEDVLLASISSLCAAAHQLSKQEDHETTEFTRIILAEASKLVQELKRLNIISPFAYDPGATEDVLDDRDGAAEG